MMEKNVYKIFLIFQKFAMIKYINKKFRSRNEIKIKQNQYLNGKFLILLSKIPKKF